MAKAQRTNPTIEEYGTTIVVEKQRDILRSIGVLVLEAAERVTSGEGELTIGRSNLFVPLFLSALELPQILIFMKLLLIHLSTNLGC